MRSIPSDSVFAAHGLHNVQLDVPQLRSAAATALTIPAADPFVTAEWIAGTALLRPSERFPLLVPSPAATKSLPVRFSFCPAFDPSSMARFRRQSQLLALGTLPTAPGPSNTRFGRVKQVLAWWEDGHGLWSVVDEEAEEGLNLVERWSQIMHDPGMEDVVDDEELVPSNLNKRLEMSVPEREAVYGEICLLLLKVVECLRALHHRHLTAIACRPSGFSLSGKAPHDFAIVNRFESISPLGSMSTPTLLGQNPLAHSGLFQHDPFDAQEPYLDEDALRKNLRYLAPEIAIQKRVSLTGDIYSFGVLAYEMLTGTTIDGGPDSPEDADVDVLIDFHRHVTMQILPPLEWLEREAQLGSLPSALPPRQLSDIIMRCLGKEADVRYSSLDSLAYDLGKLSRIIKSRGDLSKFKVGEVDDLARFSLPPRLIHRDAELGTLRKALAEVTATDRHLLARGEPLNTTRVVNVSGVSGSGKTRIVRQFAQDSESSSSSDSPVVAWAKLEESNHPPLTSFIQIFMTILDRFLADPNEDAKEWNERIRQTLGGRFPLFVSLLPTDYWRVLGVDKQHSPSPDVDWSTLRETFSSWSKRFLQLFATQRHPLIIILDDLQWLPPDEAAYWRKMLDGSHPLNHVLLLSTCRVRSSDEKPPSTVLLSPSTVNVNVPPLSEEGVLSLIKASFNDRIASGPALASFLHAETAGLSLFVRTIIANLVKENAITFDYDSLIWRFDTVQLQTHLSKAGVDAYLEKLISSLPPAAQDILFYVSYLPSRGITIDQLRDLLNKDEDEIDGLVRVCEATATLLVKQKGRLRFAHDGPKAAATKLIPPDRAAKIHADISHFLRRPQFNDDYTFDAADHALIAAEMGLQTYSNEDFVDLLLAATSRSALATSFDKAARFLDAADDAISSSGGIQSWMQDRRPVMMRFLQFHAEIACVSRKFERCLAKLKEMEPYLDSQYEKITVASLNIRLIIASGQLPEAAAMTFRTLEEHGYDPMTRVDLSALPKTAAEVEVFGKSLSSGPVDRTDIRVLIMTLMAAAGSSLYYCEPVKRDAVFNLGLSLSVSVRVVHETTAYFLVTQALTSRHDVPLKKALVTLGRTVLQQCPPSYLIGHALNGVAIQTCFWMRWNELDEDYDAAIDGNLNNANFEQATNTLAMDLGTRAISAKPVPLERTVKFYDMIRPHTNSLGKYTIELPLQYLERVQKMSSQSTPWTLEGSIVTRFETDSVKHLPTHNAFRQCLALRLAVYYDAPISELRQLVENGRAAAPGVTGLIYGVEWAFLVAVVAIRGGGDHQADVDTAFEELSANKTSPDFEHRRLFLTALQSLEKSPTDSLQVAEDVLDTLCASEQHALAGLLAYYISTAILKATNSQRLATGFLRAAAASYHQAEMFGVCGMLREKWPAVCPIAPSHGLLPSQALGVKDGVPPPLRRASISTSNETVVSQHSSGESSLDKDRIAEKKAPHDQLDALALMRSSLALASEQDQPVLLCTLLRILCQFLRAEFAAIALCDEEDNSHVRVRAAGPFSRIVPYDVRVTDEGAKQVCPTSLILHTARTGRAITSLSSVSRFRADPFFNGRLPRSLICLPILLQGKQKGVVLLSSSTIATTQSQWESAKEVVSTLATFATIITSNVSFTHRLKNEVDQRTKELTNALAAKTQFLSQCSHELRSPLSAVLGLAAVLEASSGLSDVQREHLRTIISSGEDLLGLINNILDHSRLESGSVTLEEIPFTLRDVVEGALDSVAAVAQKKNLELCLISAYDTDPPGLLGDPFRIKQILLNLLSNAVKFTQEGRVTVRWRWEEVPDQGIFLELDVEDTGIGIPAQKMDKLFRSFSQIDESITRSFGGSGLGLIISKDLAKLLGGDCTATSNLGSGSKFTFSLVAKRDPKHKQDLRKLDKPRSCFIICPPGPWWNMLEENLRILNCEPVRFADTIQDCLVKDHPEGLNSSKQFNYVMLDTDMVDDRILTRMKELQPDARMLYLVRSIDLAKTIRELSITRETIISRPIKFSSLVRAMLPNPDAMDKPMINKTEKSNKKVNRRMSQDKPLAILLVDDNAVNVTVGRRILELFGYKTVTSAGDGQQAIEVAEKRQFDLILLDLQMPVLDGFTAQKRIKASPLAGDPCIVALTANADQETQQSCREAGFFNYLSKPLDIPRLEKILGEVWEWRQKRKLTGANGEKAEGEVMDKPENVNIEKTLKGVVGHQLKHDEKEIKDVREENEVRNAQDAPDKGTGTGLLKREGKKPAGDLGLEEGKDRKVKDERD